MRYFSNLKDDEKEQILNYKLTVYICSGTDSQKLSWFKTINIAGEKLSKQKLRNAVYSGSWVTDAKKYFSKNGCAAYQVANKYLTGAANRQDYLETAISWEAGSGSDEAIELYMANRQHDSNALLLWNNFRSVITWVDGTFTKYRPPMKGVDWGALYKEYSGAVFDTGKIEAETARLMLDDDVTKKSGIYPFILTRDKAIWQSGLLPPLKKTPLTKNKRAFALYAANSFPLKKWKATIYGLGRKAAKPAPIICKCCAKTATDGKGKNKYRNGGNAARNTRFVLSLPRASLRRIQGTRKPRGDTADSALRTERSALRITRAAQGHCSGFLKKPGIRAARNAEGAKPPRYILYLPKYISYLPRYILYLLRYTS
jgi:hypothetical protein